jgi:hypothetical protein
VQNVEDDDVVLVQVALVGARSEGQDELEVRELVKVDNERRLRCESASQPRSHILGNAVD